MNDENHKKHPEVTAHPLPEGKTADTGECVHVTEPLIKTATPEEASTAIPGMDRTQTQTEEEREQEQPQSSNFTLRKILGGDILSARLFRNNIWLIITIVLFVIVYISNRYSVQKYLIEIDKLNTELEDAKYRALSSSSQLTEKTRESHILELLKNRKDSVLKMSDRPPYIINVPEK